MADPDKITVDKTYFDALLRRADFHTSSQGLGTLDSTNVVISRVEYSSLLRNLREYESLKIALFNGGITTKTLDLLTGAATNGSGHRKDSAFSVDQDIPLSTYDQHAPLSGNTAVYEEIPSSYNGGSGTHSGGNVNSFAHRQNQPERPPYSRQMSYQFTESLMPDDRMFDANDSFEEGTHVNLDTQGQANQKERRTLYMSGLSDRTTYKDLVAVLRGGKLLSVNIRPDRTALVTFLDGAAEFLAWARRNDIYLHAKRIEVTWADRQYHLNNHILNKTKDGTSRNILVHNALSKGLTEDRIRVDMEHIHNLVVIDVTFRGNDAYVSTNSIHNALFARTCMMSRSTYRGCKIEFFRDECDAPLPVRQNAPNPTMMRPEPRRKKSLANRFDLLDMVSRNASSNEENEPPIDSDEDDDDSSSFA